MSRYRNGDYSLEEKEESLNISGGKMLETPLGILWIGNDGMQQP